MSEEKSKNEPRYGRIEDSDSVVSAEYMTSDNGVSFYRLTTSDGRQVDVPERVVGPAQEMPMTLGELTGQAKRRT